MTASSPRLTRDRPIVRGRAALLVIDVQNGTFSAHDKSARPAFYDAAASPRHSQYPEAAGGVPRARGWK